MVSEARVSVVVPTVGRPELLTRLLNSLAKCDPRASDVLVVDQSENDAVAEVVERYAQYGVRRVQCHGVGVAHARNVGLRAARYDVTLWTDDDCTVASDWVRVGSTCLDEATMPTIITGRVLPTGNGSRVPSTIVTTERREYRGLQTLDILYSGNMALQRSQALALGGFDEALPAAEDNDLCYRWLAAGYCIRYEPALVVRHLDWRTDTELEALYFLYGRGRGLFYAKHFRRCRHRMIAAFLDDVAGSGLAFLRRLIRERVFDRNVAATMFGLPVGFVQGLKRRRFGS